MMCIWGVRLQPQRVIRVLEVLLTYNLFTIKFTKVSVRFGEFFCFVLFLSKFKWLSSTKRVLLKHVHQHKFLHA